MYVCMFSNMRRMHTCLFVCFCLLVHSVQVYIHMCAYVWSPDVNPQAVSTFILFWRVDSPTSSWIV